MAQTTGGRVYVPVTGASQSWQYGLQSQSSVITGNNREAFAGVDIDIDDCYLAIPWIHDCPEPVTRTVTVTLTGERTGTDPNFEYTITGVASITPENGRTYQLNVMVGTVLHEMSTDDQTSVRLYSGPTPYSGDITVIASSKDQTNVVVQTAADGSVTPENINLQVEERGEDPNEPKDTRQPGQDWLAAESFTVYAIGPPCTGADALDRAQQRATNRLIAGEWATVESMTQMSILSQSKPEIPTGDTAVPLAQALAGIEYGMRGYGGPGVIHIPRQAHGYWRHIVRNGPRLETRVGHGLAFGRGYRSMAPDGPENDDLIDPTQVWIYGTGAVRIWRSAISTPGNRSTTFDWEQNASRAIAERSYTVAVQCPYVAALVDFTE